MSNVDVIDNLGNGDDNMVNFTAHKACNIHNSRQNYELP